jgi:hypothetical protein
LPKLGTVTPLSGWKNSGAAFSIRAMPAAGTLVHLTSISEWSDFDDRHDLRFAQRDRKRSLEHDRAK